MRDVAKSMVRLPWSLFMAGVEQTQNLLTRPDGWSRASAALDAISASAEQELSGGLRELYRAGDQVQAGMVDAALDLVGGGWINPTPSLGRAWEAVERSWSAATRAVREAS